MKIHKSSFKIKTNSMAYLCILDQEKSPGVYNKVSGTVKGAEKNGYKTRIWCDPPKPGYLKRMSDMIINSEEKVLLIRSLCQYNFFLVYAFIIARLQGKRIIIDVPTPNRVAIQEIANGDKSLFGKFKSLLYLSVSGPIPFWFVKRVVQYAKEGEWFLLGNKSKTKLIGNGIDFESFPPRKKLPSWPSSRLKLIVVAALNYWHGVDRLIKAMHVFNKNPSTEFKVHLTVVGEGLALNELKKLMVDLDLQKDIDFKGFLKGQNLNECYENCHAGVGSLGLFRIKLNEASILKAREYTVLGLPFIASGDDPDFPEGTSFRYKVANSDEIDSILQFFQDFNDFYGHVQLEDIRLFAREKLDYAAKFHQITQGL